MSKVTTTQEYVYRSAHELARLVREGHATNVDIVKEHLARIKERNGELNALVLYSANDFFVEAR